MCGITAIIQKNDTTKIENNEIFDLLMNSLEQLQNRGYDSLGIGYIEKTNTNDVILHTKKTCDVHHLDMKSFVSEDSMFKTMDVYGTVLGHTRWATHGSKTVKNAHPHTSMNGVFSLVHNGIIENYVALKRFLIEKDYAFKSETDSEIIVNLLEYYFVNDKTNLKEKEKSVCEILRMVSKMLQGTYGLAIICKYTPDRIYCIKNGSPLIIGENNEYIIASSEVAGFYGMINHYYSLESNQIFVLDANSGIRHMFDNKEEIQMNKVDKGNMLFESSADPYKHWTIKEILEQPVTLMNTINQGARIYNGAIHLGGLIKYADVLSKVSHVVLLGCGSSMYAAQCAQYYFKEISNIETVSVHDGADFTLLDLPKTKRKSVKGLHDGNMIMVVICSQSGETMDLLKCIQRLKSEKHRCVLVGIVNVVDSQIAREVDCGVYLNVGREVSVASTKAFNSALLTFYMIATWLRVRLDGNYEHQQIKCTENIRQLIHKMKMNTSQYLSMGDDIYERYELERINRASLFILGKGKMESIAKECALKFKEMAYLHAEGCNSSALKHGPFALLTADYPVILLIDKEHKQKLLNTYEEIVSRGAYVLIITDCLSYELASIECNKGTLKNIIYVPYVECLQEILFTHVMQMLAYAISIKNGINPDKPRNLAKVVTVE
tara:strand:- start:276 stop:2264 length:1989 start_codon:yes stop_codon:yes gene_type:complete